MTPFSTVKIRTAATVTCGHEIALIHWIKNGAEQYTLPGGNVEPGESLIAALHRELAEELNLHLDPATQPPLLAVTRPDGLPPGSHPTTSQTPPDLSRLRDPRPTSRHGRRRTRRPIGRGNRLEPLQDLPALHLYPAVGDLLAKLDTQQPTPTTLLPPLTDDNFRWI